MPRWAMGSNLNVLILKRQCQPQCICLHFTLKVMECQQITIINISLVLCRYNSVKMSKYNHRMVEIYDGLKTKTWITLPMLLFEHCLSAQCIVVDIVPLIRFVELHLLTLIASDKTHIVVYNFELYFYYFVCMRLPNTLAN
jgi:hypothetical protein